MFRPVKIVLQQCKPDETKAWIKNSESDIIHALTKALALFAVKFVFLIGIHHRNHTCRI